MGRIPEDRDAGGRRNDLLEELKPLCAQIHCNVGEPREVRARPREAGDEPSSNRIADAHRDNWDCRRCLLGRTGRGRTRRHDEVNPQTDEFARASGEPIEPPLPPSVLKSDVLSLHVAKWAQTLPECVPMRPGHVRENTDPPDLPRRLRISGQWRREDAEGEGDDEGG